MKTVYFFRHGETDWNAQRRLQGRSDVPLNENGRQQAHRLGPLLTTHPVSRIISSPLQRAVETAEIISTYLNVEVHTDERLVEISYGDADGRLASEMAAHFPPETIQSIATVSPDGCYPNGETNRSASTRFRQALEDRLSDPSTDHIGICAHGAIFRRFVLLEFHEDNRPHSIEVPNCELFILRYEPENKGFRFESLTPTE